MIAIFLFYNIANGKQSALAFSKEFRHCNIITYDGDDWVNYDLDRTGVHTRVLKVSSGDRLMERLKSIKTLSAMVAVSVDKPVAISWKLYWVRTCNEFNRYVSGADVGLTFNPRHLYNKLLKYNGKRNYKVLSAWRRNTWVSSAEAEAVATIKSKDAPMI